MSDRNVQGGHRMVTYVLVGALVVVVVVVGAIFGGKALSDIIERALHPTEESAQTPEAPA